MDDIASGGMPCGQHTAWLCWQPGRLLSVTLTDRPANSEEDREPPVEIRLLALLTLQQQLDWQDPLQEALAWSLLETRRLWLDGVIWEDRRPGDARNVIPLRRADHSMN